MQILSLLNTYIANSQDSNRKQIVAATPYLFGIIAVISVLLWVNSLPMNEILYALTISTSVLFVHMFMGLFIGTGEEEKHHKHFDSNDKKLKQD